MGIDQRDYFNSNKNSGDYLKYKFSSLFKNWDVVNIIIAINIITFILNSLGIGRDPEYFSYSGALNWAGLAAGKIWLLVTYMFIHDGIIHIVFNMVICFFSGKAILHITGPKKFLQLYFASGILAGFAQVAYNKILMLVGYPQVYDFPIVGASGSTTALLLASCLIYYHEKITLLLFFAFPLRATGKRLIQGILIISIALEITGLLLRPFYNIPFLTNVAHVAHIVGGIIGLLMMKKFLLQSLYNQTNSTWSNITNNFKLPRKNKTTKKQKPSSDTADKNRRMDEILEKIHQKGFDKLTEDEKRFLIESSQSMQER